MKTIKFLFYSVLLVSSLIIGCVAYVPGPPPDGYYAPGSPPSALVEVRPAIPYPDALWIDGYWAHHGGRWAWRGGYWDRRPHAGAVWHQGYWQDYGRRGWGWRPGYWR